MDPKPLLNCKSIVKSFGENHVLKGVDFDLYPGEVVSVIGGNGAGKSTLMKIIMGIYSCDGGDLSFNGKNIKHITPSVALSNGVYLVPQEPMLFENMTVQENILLGIKGNKAELKGKLLQLLEELKWNIDLSRKANTLSIAEQQLVEILKGVIRESKILILDEPTSSLTFNEIQSLFSLVERLKKKGVGIIYITHRLNEVFEISTDVVIMRDGQITLKGKVSEFTNEKLIEALLPAENELTLEKELIDEIIAIDDITDRHAVLEINNVTGNGFADVSFSVYSGEILGLAGVVGAGRTELAESIFGRDEVFSGEVILEGKKITGLSTKKIIESGLNYVPEDRFKNGIFKISNIGMNISSSSLTNMGKVFTNHHYEELLYQEYQNSFKIKASSIDEEIGDLSGGNQQKIVIAKALASIPKLLILDEPTRGIDAGAREDVYKIIYRLKAQGVAILLISSDMEEIVQLSDRAITMYRGRINQEYKAEEITPDNLMRASFGVVEEVI